MKSVSPLSPFLLLIMVLMGLPLRPTKAASLNGTFASISAGSIINLSSEGETDWVHWGLYTETSLNRKASVVPQISDFTLLDAPTGYAFVYQYSDNENGYSWSDGTPTASVTNTTTGVWAYGTPQIGSGFEITAPADTAMRTLKVYVGSYGARGLFEAYLSDGSARGYTNSSLFNMANGPSGTYTVNYAANSDGQQLVVRWTLTMFTHPDGNVTLQAAALTSPNANNPPYVALTTPANDSSYLAGSPIVLNATADDLDGNVGTVEFFADGTRLGEDSSSPYSFTWNNAPSGMHLLTAVATDLQGAASTSSPVEIFVVENGGTLNGELIVPPALPMDVNLTTEGTTDWAHWGFETNSMFNRKADVVAQISDFTKIGSNAVQRYADNYSGYSWTDGTPTLGANDSTTGVFTTGVTNGFELTVPADTTLKTLKVYVGLYGAQGHFQAWLNDFSAAPFTDTTLSNFFGNAYGVYTLNFSASAPGRTLTVRYRSKSLFDLDFGNVTLQAATLSTGSVSNGPPVVMITNPPSGTVLTAPASFIIDAVASDSDGSVSQVEFYNGGTLVGTDSSSPYSVSINGLGAGNYVFSAVATDNLGVSATNSIALMVNAPPSVSITSPTNGNSFAGPANIKIDVDAQDSDGTIRKVEFFEASNKLGEDLESPFGLTWSNVVAGSYNLFVRATDDHGAVTTSALVAITVTNSPALPVTLFNPERRSTDFMFSFESVSGVNYEIQYVDTLDTSNWQVLGNVQGSGSTTIVTNKDVSASQRFYRVETK